MMKPVVEPHRAGRTRRAPRARRASAVLTPVLALAVAGASTGLAGQDPSPGDPSVGAAEQAAMQWGGAARADFDWALETLDGRSISLSEYRGEVLVINMWATWCAPCVAELRSFRALATSMEGTGVRFLLISPEDPEHVRRFLRQYGYGDLPVLVEGRPMPDAFGLEALPTTWVVDHQGRIVLKRRGAADWDSDEVRRFLVQLDRRALAGG